MSAGLEIRGLSKTFDRPRQLPIEALRDINLGILEGEFVSIVGASGSGKSTLLRIIDGLIPPSSGSVQVGSHTVTSPGRDRAMVFQADGLLPWRTVIDNVGFGLELNGVSRSAARSFSQRIINVVGLKGFEQSYPRQLSGGMRQRVNVARALAVNPRVLLLDEPFSSLDAQTREIMQSELLRIWEEHRTTVLLVTHQIDEAIYLSDRVVVFSSRPGTVIANIPVNFPRPRELSIKRTPEFTDISQRIWSLIEHEVWGAVEKHLT